MKREERKCPYCEATERQHSIGKTKAGSRRFRCICCKREYTPNPKKWKYTEEERSQALRLLLLGNSGRAVGKALGMSKANAYRWAIKAKKGAYGLWISPNTKTDVFELDEIYWFVGKRKGYENGVNVYIMTMLSRQPRQIVAFAVDNSVKAERIQEMVDNTIPAEKYCTDGGQVYLGVDFIGCHKRNIRDKSDTHNIEGSNADIRHYIAGLRRRSRCFFRRIETLIAVLGIFAYAYNKFGAAKLQYRLRHPDCDRDFHFNHLDYI